MENLNRTEEYMKSSVGKDSSNYTHPKTIESAIYMRKTPKTKKKGTTPVLLEDNGDYMTFPLESSFTYGFEGATLFYLELEDGSYYYIDATSLDNGVLKDTDGTVLFSSGKREECALSGNGASRMKRLIAFSRSLDKESSIVLDTPLKDPIKMTGAHRSLVYLFKVSGENGSASRLVATKDSFSSSDNIMEEFGLADYTGGVNSKEDPAMTEEEYLQQQKTLAETMEV